MYPANTTEYYKMLISIVFHRHAHAPIKKSMTVKEMIK